MKIGIVGLPNVGKSTLFNALTKAGVPAANYPFCTIEPNVGVVAVPDARLEKLTELSKSKQTIYAMVDFVDIAGLVGGASKGEGLGNKFLSHIREVDAIAQVVRVFVDGDVQHVHKNVDPKHDMDVIETELLLADLQLLETQLVRAKSDAKGGSEAAMLRLATIEKLIAHLESEQPARTLELTPEEKESIKEIQLITAKPMLYVLNVSEADAAGWTEEKTKALGLDPAHTVAVSSKIEQELSELSAEDKAVFLADLGLTHSGLDDLIPAAYRTLQLQTFFTTGEQESRAWTTAIGATAPQAGNAIHSDFEEKFIRAEVVAYDDFVAAGGYAGAREKGKLRVEGKTYIVQDGDIMEFKI